MKLTLKIQVLLSITLLFIVSMVLVDVSDQRDQKNETIQAQQALIHTQETKIRMLTEKLQKSETALQAQKPLIENLLKNVDISNMEKHQIQKASEISVETPLDFEAALCLVKYADRYDIEYSLVLSIIEIESNFNRNLVGTSQDRGYMQIIPGTEKWLAEQYGEELGIRYNPKLIFDPEYNLALGIKYLDELIALYGNQLDRILSEYNRGPINLQRYYAKNNTYSTTYSRSVLSRTGKYIRLNVR